MCYRRAFPNTPKPAPTHAGPDPGFRTSGHSETRACAGAACYTTEHMVLLVCAHALVCALAGGRWGLRAAARPMLQHHEAAHMHGASCVATLQAQPKHITRQSLVHFREVPRPIKLPRQTTSARKRVRAPRSCWTQLPAQNVRRAILVRQTLSRPHALVLPYDPGRQRPANAQPRVEISEHPRHSMPAPVVVTPRPLVSVMQPASHVHTTITQVGLGAGCMPTVACARSSCRGRP